MTDRNAGRDPVFAELDRLIEEAEPEDAAYRLTRDPVPLIVPEPYKVKLSYRERRMRYLRETGRVEKSV